MTAKSVYVSYSRKVDEITPLVDELGEICVAYGLDFRIDKNRIKYGDLISSFMDELGNNDDIILIFSLPYFKSRYCMYELLQIWKKGNVQQRVHPILIGELCLDDADFQLGVIKHWEYEAQSLQEKLNGYNSGSTIALRRRQVVFSEISHEVGNLLDFVSNMRFLSSDELRHQEFKPLLERISPILIISTKIKTNSNNNNRDIEKDRLSSLVKDLEIKHLRIKKNINQLSNEIVELK
jgi:hypothetical protein